MSRPGHFFRRALNRAIREATSRFGLPPRWTGYRHLPSEWPPAYVERMRARRSPFKAEHEVIEPAGQANVPLPGNVRSREDLPRSTGKWGFSFYDVPDRRLRPTTRTTVSNARALSWMDPWGDESFALVTDEDRVLMVRGTGYVPGHAARLRSPARMPHLDRAWWILEQWNRNYSHWLQWHLPKIAWIQARNGPERILMPRPDRLSGVVDQSVRMLGIDPAICPVFQSELLHVGELSFLDIDDYRPSLLARLRDGIVAAAQPRRSGRKIFISRAKALRRRQVNEEECWRGLEPLGYERVCMEDLGFAEQVNLMAETQVLLSLHGSGLANMIFAPQGCQVVEIYERAFPNPQFYALAGALGHRYWLVEGKPTGIAKPGYDDVAVDLEALRQVVERIEKQTAGCRPRGGA